MANQGATTKEIARTLQEVGWQVVYTCIPNTPHVNVVPISTPSGSSNQRYPDIVAFRQDDTKLIEVEIRLNRQVTNDLVIRFKDMIDALKDDSAWQLWRHHIYKTTGYHLPKRFRPHCDLVICQPIPTSTRWLAEELKSQNISVFFVADYISAIML